MIRVVAVCLTVLVAGCGDSTYGKAAVGTGATVAAVALYRAVTKGCWGQCRAGYLCNQENGVCEPGECMPPCSAGAHCIRTVQGDLACQQDPTTFSAGPRTTPRPAIASPDGGRDGGAPQDAAAAR